MLSYTTIYSQSQFIIGLNQDDSQFETTNLHGIEDGPGSA